MPTNKKAPGPPPAVPEHIVRKRIEAAETKANMAGSGLAVVLMLTVLLDKFGMEDQIRDVWPRGSGSRRRSWRGASSSTS